MTELGHPLAISATISSIERGNRLMCEGCTLSLIPGVAKAVKTASVIHPNQNHEPCDALRRSALLCISSLSTFSHRGNPAVSIPFFRLQ
jgi:hypothetical protein